MFVENSTSFFKLIGELKKDKSKGLIWEFYTPFFYEIAKSEHIETYCKYITQVGYENAAKWLEENPSKLDDFDLYLKG